MKVVVLVSTGPTLTLRLDDDGDIVFDDLGRLEMIEGPDAVRQGLRIRMITRLREWFLDAAFGIPWLELLGEKPVNVDRIRDEVSTALLRDPDVESIRRLDIDLDPLNRKLVVRFAVQVRDAVISDAVGVEL